MRRGSGSAAQFGQQRTNLVALGKTLTLVAQRFQLCDRGVTISLGPVDLGQRQPQRPRVVGARLGSSRSSVRQDKGTPHA